MAAMRIGRKLLAAVRIKFDSAFDEVKQSCFYFLNDLRRCAHS